MYDKTDISEVSVAISVNLKEGCSGDLASREAGRVSGQMVKKVVPYELRTI